MKKIKFPGEYIKEGRFVLNSGLESNIKYEVEELLTNPLYLNYVLDNIPLSEHYIGIASGGALMAIAAHSRFSMVKKNEFYGEKPEGAWVLIDDVVTTDGSLNKAIKLIKRKPDKIIVAVDRRDLEGTIKTLEVISLFQI